MAVDAKIELFACELFNELWNEYSDTYITIPFEIVNDTDVPLESEITDDILKAVMCRRALFYYVHSSMFVRDYDEFFESTADFYAYLRKSFPCYLFERTTIMEAVIASCAFVVEMCIFSSQQQNYIFTDKAHLIWAMFFDTELKQQFYAEGGWSVLKRNARPYMECYIFLAEHHHKYSPKRGTKFFMWPVEKTIAAAQEFKQFLLEALPVNYNITMSTKFVHHCILDNSRPLPKTAMLPICGEASSTEEGLENLLQYMKFMCDPGAIQLIEYDKKISSGNVPPRVFYEPKTGKVFTVGATPSNASGSKTESPSSPVSPAENPTEEQSNQSFKEDNQEQETIFALPSNKQDSNESPVSSPIVDSYNIELGEVLSKSDINTTSPVKVLSPKENSGNNLGQSNEGKPAKKRKSGGKENSPTEMTLSRFSSHKITLAKEHLPSNKQNSKTNESPVGLPTLDSYKIELGEVLSKSDINTTSPVKVLSPKENSGTNLGQSKEEKPARKRKSGGKENSPSEMPLSRFSSHKITHAKEHLSSRGKVGKPIEKQKSKSRMEETTRISNSTESQIQSEEINTFLSTEHQKSGSRSTENEIQYPDQVLPTGYKIDIDQINKFLELRSKEQSEQDNELASAEVKTENQTPSPESSETKISFPSDVPSNIIDLYTEKNAEGVFCVPREFKLQLAPIQSHGKLMSNPMFGGIESKACPFPGCISSTSTMNEVASNLNKIYENKESKRISPNKSTISDDPSLNEAEIPYQCEPVSYDIKDMMRMMLVLGSPPGLRYVRSTLHNNKKDNEGIKQTQL